MMIILFLDTETTGLGDDAEVIEIGCEIYDTSQGVAGVVVEAWSTLVTPRNWSRKAERVHGIPIRVAEGYGAMPEEACDRLAADIHRADVVVAHNGAAFDSPMLERMFTRVGRTMPDTRWVDSMHVDYPRWSRSRSLDALCAAHGVVRTHAHRALGDAQDVRRLLERAAELATVDRVAELSRRVTVEDLIIETIARESWPMVYAVSEYRSPEHRALQADGWSWHGGDVAAYGKRIDPDRVTGGHVTIDGLRIPVRYGERVDWLIAHAEDSRWWIVDGEAVRPLRRALEIVAGLQCDSVAVMSASLCDDDDLGAIIVDTSENHVRPDEIHIKQVTPEQARTALTMGGR